MTPTTMHQEISRYILTLSQAHTVRVLLWLGIQTHGRQKMGTFQMAARAVPMPIDHYHHYRLDLRQCPK